jgi:hypothetical protein
MGAVLFRDPMWMVSAAFLVIGIGLAAGAGWHYRSTRAFLETAIRVEGVVIEMRRRGGSSAPIVRFQPPEGPEVTFESKLYTRPPTYSVGEKVTVLFQSARPDEARLYGFWDLYLLTVVLGGIGAVFTLLGIVFTYCFVLRQ